MKQVKILVGTLQHTTSNLERNILQKIYAAPISNHHTKGKNQKDFILVFNELINGTVFNNNVGQEVD